MTDDQIKHMVNRFLQWRLPQPWHPDAGISFKPSFAEEPMHSRHWPVGTNLFSYTQAEAMVRHMVAEMQEQPPSDAVSILAEVFADFDKVHSLDWTDRAAEAITKAAT